MKSFNFHPAFSVAAVAVFTASGIMGWLIADRPMAAVTFESPTQVTGKRAEHRARPARSSPADLAGRQMDSIRLAGSPEARIRATIDLANSLSLAEIAEWMDHRGFNLRGGPELMLFTKIITKRWQLEDETGLLTWTLARAIRNPDGTTEQFELMKQNIAKLAEKAPQLLIDFFKTHPHSEFELRALSKIASSHPDIALSRFQEVLASGNPDAYFAKELFEELAKSSPEKFADLLGSLPTNFRIEAESILSQTRMRESFATEIRNLWSRPDGLCIFQNSLNSVEDVRTKILGELANLPPEWRSQIAFKPHYYINGKNAEQWWSTDFAAAGFSAKDAERMRLEALSVFGRKQPEEAIRRLDELNLTESARNNFLARLPKINYSDDDFMLESDSDPQGMRELKKSKPQNITVKDPLEWLARASEIDITRPYEGVILSLLGKWDHGKTTLLTEGFTALEPGKKKHVAQVIIRGMGKYTENPAEPARIYTDALRYLVTNPPSSADGSYDAYHTVFLCSSYVVDLSANDPVAASEWVGSLPASDAKFLAQRNLFDNWVQYDPNAAKQWQKSLPAAEQARFEQAAR